MCSKVSFDCSKRKFVFIHTRERLLKVWISRTFIFRRASLVTVRQIHKLFYTEMRVLNEEGRYFNNRGSSVSALC